MNNPSDAPAPSRPYSLVGLTAAVTAAIALTWFIILRNHSMPIGDGGLWYVTAHAVLDGRFWLPTTIFFNGAEQPLSYPPLGAYLLAGLHRITGIEIMSLITWLPLAGCLLSIAAFRSFARRYFKEKHYADIAAVFFPMTLLSAPAFFFGGAVSRAPGLLFQLLAWSAASARPASPRAAHLRTAAVGVCVGAAGLTHPNAGLWAAAGVVFLAVFEHRLSRRELFFSGLIGAAVAAPWLITAVRAHGAAPFLNAFQIGGEEMWGGWRSFGKPQNFLCPGGLYGAVGILGLCLLIRERYVLAPLLVVLGLLVDHRGLLALHGLPVTALAIAPLCALVWERLGGRAPSESAPEFTRASRAAFSLIVSLPFVISLIGVFLQHRRDPVPLADMTAFADEVRAAAAPEDRILYLRTTDIIERGEWLAALSGRRLFPISQGEEWAGGYARSIELRNKISTCCQHGSLSCLTARVKPDLPEGEFIVAIDKATCGGILPDLAETPGIKLGERAVFLSGSRLFAAAASPAGP